MKVKLIVFCFLILLLGANFYFFYSSPDIFTQSKIQLSALDGSTSYFGRLKLWQLLAQSNNWNEAATLESDLNQPQVKNYKSANQPDKLQQKITELNHKSPITADDYLEIARMQSILGLSSQAIDSIKKAHQLDPIRPDVDKLFYSLAK